MNVSGCSSHSRIIFSHLTLISSTLVFQNHVWVDVTKHNSNLPPLAVKNPECLGLLHKMDKNKEMWVQHYCILKDGCLSLYSGIRATHAHGMGICHVSNVDMQSDSIFCGYAESKIRLRDRRTFIFQFSSR